MAALADAEANLPPHTIEPTRTSLVLVAGAARVLQLRVVARRHRRTDQAP